MKNYTNENANSIFKLGKLCCLRGIPHGLSYDVMQIKINPASYSLSYASRILSNNKRKRTYIFEKS